MHDKTVLIVDDEALARARLIKLLGQCPGYSVCGREPELNVYLRLFR